MCFDKFADAFFFSDNMRLYKLVRCPRLPSNRSGFEGGQNVGPKYRFRKVGESESFHGFREIH